MSNIYNLPPEMISEITQYLNFKDSYSLKMSNIWLYIISQLITTNNIENIHI